MTILYEGFNGRPGIPILGGILIVLGILAIGAFIYFLMKKDTQGIGALLGFAIVCITAGIVFNHDARIPVVKAMVNEEISWQEINNKYELVKQEDQIYIFKVKNITNEEWENHLKEKENKK